MVMTKAAAIQNRLDFEWIAVRAARPCSSMRTEVFWVSPPTPRKRLVCLSIAPMNGVTGKRTKPHPDNSSKRR